MDQEDGRFLVPWTRVRDRLVLFSVLFAHLPYEEDTTITATLQMVKLRF